METAKDKHTLEFVTFIKLTFNFHFLVHCRGFQHSQQKNSSQNFNIIFFFYSFIPGLILIYTSLLLLLLL